MSSKRCSAELQIGKAAEHIACADLIMQGHNAFLSDAGLPYDMIVDIGDKLYRVQVKGTRQPLVRTDRPSNEVSYRFGTRRGRAYGRIDADAVDVFAFVALDIRKVAYVRTDEMLSPDGRVVGIMEFADEASHRRWGTRTFQKRATFPTAPSAPPTEHSCFRCGTIRALTVANFCHNKRCASGFVGVCRECSRPENTQSARVRRELKKEQINAAH